MLNYFYSDPRFLQCCHSGPLGPQLDQFAKLLKETGYTRLSGQDKMRVITQLNQWMAARQVGLQQLGDQKIRAFRAYRCKHRSSHHGEGATLAHFLQMLREADLIPTGPERISKNPIDLLVRDYSQFLVQERGLSQITLGHRLPIAHQFLFQCFRSAPLRLDKLQARDVSRFVLRAVRAQRRDYGQLVTTTLRSFLDFLYQGGRLKISLRAAVPAVASGRPSELPTFLEPKQIEQLLRGCDRRSLCGRRDYAILLLLARLGLRVDEVRGLTLDDINWESGEVLVRGKRGREDRLPLPADVGRAIADYLRNGRPRCSCRQVFLRLVAPHTGMVGPTISGIVERALTRAGISAAHRGGHLLRHSLATSMLRGGASLSQIGQVLRHKSIDTTEIYARVDQKALRALAQPWSGGVR
jgi:site-specific recombinase XerD